MKRCDGKEFDDENRNGTRSLLTITLAKIAIEKKRFESWNKKNPFSPFSIFFSIFLIFSFEYYFPSEKKKKKKIEILQSFDENE